MDNLQSELYTGFDKNPAPVTAFVLWLAQVYALQPSLRVLDIGCGPGRMLAEYERLGWSVTGMEPDDDFYNSAREVVADFAESKVLRGGFGEIHFEAAFDLVTAINNPISYLLDVPARLDALERVYRALKPGGVFFLEFTNFLYKIQNFEPVTVQNKEVDGEQVTHIMENHVDLHHGRWILKDQYIVPGRDEVICKEHRQAIIILPELLYFLENQGFVNLKTFSSYHARASEPVTGKQILVTAQKPL
jgi:SAM-dependent methyltransferase